MELNSKHVLLCEITIHKFKLKIISRYSKTFDNVLTYSIDYYVINLYRQHLYIVKKRIVHT